MKKRAFLTAALAALLLVGCSSGDAEKTAAPTAASTAPASKKDPDLQEIGAVNALAYSADGSTLYAGTETALWAKGKDGWEQINNYNITMMVLTEKTLYISGIAPEDAKLRNPIGVLKSNNGGAKFEAASLAGIATLGPKTAASFRTGTLYTYVEKAQNKFKAGLYYSKEDGANWTPAEAKLQGVEIRALAAHPDYGNVVALATRQGIRFSEDYGATIVAESTFFKNATALAFDLQNPDTLFVATQDETGSKLYAFNNYRKLRTADKNS
jgi:hypothetical protein